LFDDPDADLRDDAAKVYLAHPCAAAIEALIDALPARLSTDMSYRTKCSVIGILAYKFHEGGAPPFPEPFPSRQIRAWYAKHKGEFIWPKEGK